ncbi:MAG: GNAT family N-acetyltransferase [Bacteroidota bacterium]
MEFFSYTTDNKPESKEIDRITDFLYEHLDQFRDEWEHIRKAIQYSLKETSDDGGYVITSEENGQITGAVVVNRTGMEGYIPENILVYIAVNKDYRGKGLGKQLMNKAIELADGAIALHVEHDNPARYLYEKLGFTNKYLEMRLYPQE